MSSKTESTPTGGPGSSIGAPAGNVGGPAGASSGNLGGVRVCGIADALDVVGERWSLLVLREIGFGVRRFNDIRINTGAPRETLTARLRKLEECGVITRHRYSEHPPREEYELTPSGRELGPILKSLRIWGEKHARG